MENGLKISNNKTKCMHFFQINKMLNQPALIPNSTKISITPLYKFLSITLDPKLSFIALIEPWRIKCNQTNQLLRTIAHTDWGTDKKPNQIIQISNLIKAWLWLLHIKSNQKLLHPRTLYCP